MIKRYLFSGGMNEVLPAEAIAENCAAVIHNMRLRDDDCLEAIRTPKLKVHKQTGLLLDHNSEQILDTNSATIEIDTNLSPDSFSWTPVYMPQNAGSNESSVFVVFSKSGGVSLLYKGESGEYIDSGNLLKQGGSICIPNLITAQDAQQFVFIDGRENNPARRITIDRDGNIHCRRFGTEQPTTAPIINSLANSKYEDGKYTGMPVGSILYYAYCIVNEYGERSNPSPIAILDTAQWLAKGEILIGDYVYSDVNGGSIKSVSVTCQIPVPEEARAIELYRASCEYFESSRPLDPMRLVLSQNITKNQSSITLTDSYFPSPIDIDYENDSAPAGDDIALESGTMFIANAVADRTFPFPIDRVWAITITNPNPICYANRPVTIDIKDETHRLELGEAATQAADGHFEGLENASLLMTDNRYRFIDSDMVTPIQSAMNYRDGSDRFQRQSDGQWVYPCALTTLMIPYLAASSTKTIYLVRFAEAAPDHYGSLAADISTSNNLASYLDSMIDVPVRDEQAILVLGQGREDVNITDGFQKAQINKANALWISENRNVLSDKVYPQMLIPNDRSKAVQSTRIKLQGYNANKPHLFDKVNEMPYSDRGFVFGSVCSTGTDNVALFEIKYNDHYINSNSVLLSALWQRLYLERNTQNEDKVFKITPCIRKWDTQGDYSEELAAPVQIIVPNMGASEPYWLHIFYSWHLIPDGSDVKTEYSLGLAVISESGDVYTSWLKSTMRDYGLRHGPAITLTNNVNAINGQWYVSHGEFIDATVQKDEVLAFWRNDTYYPASPIGYRSELTTDGYIVNTNVTWENYTLRNEMKPGKIRWSLAGAMPQIYERNIYEDIMRIIPLKSFQPTDEHNTLLIWTDSRLAIMALSGDNQESSSLVTELYGIGLQNRKSLARVQQGVIWSERNGIHLYTAAGHRDIGSQRIQNRNYRLIYNHRNQEVLFFINNISCYAYSLKYDFWYSASYVMGARTFIEYDGNWCLITDDGIYVLNDASQPYLVPNVVTRKFHARHKLNRLTVHGSDSTVVARIYNHRLATSPNTSPQYELKNGVPKGIPQLSGDHVQFTIRANILKWIDIEDRNGN